MHPRDDRQKILGAMEGEMSQEDRSSVLLQPIELNLDSSWHVQQSPATPAKWMETCTYWASSLPESFLRRTRRPVKRIPKFPAPCLRLLIHTTDGSGHPMDGDASAGRPSENSGSHERGDESRGSFNCPSPTIELNLDSSWHV